MTAYTKTTNFLVKDSLPTGDAGKIIKGSEFDTEFNNLQTAINSKANIISPTFTGVPTAPTAIAGTNSNQLATTEFVQTAAAAAFPSGGIIIWSGSSAAIPTGWYLCDGNNSTPDLRNRFVVGAGSTYNVNDTGGSADAVLVEHTHTATVTDPGHNHTWGRGLEGDDDGFGGSNAEYTRAAGSDATVIQTATTGISVSVNSAGVSGTNANLPPYYALCYIMKA
jgi:hypothetical protein